GAAVRKCGCKEGRRETQGRGECVASDAGRWAPATRSPTQLLCPRCASRAPTTILARERRGRIKIARRETVTSADLQKLVGQKPFVPLRLYVGDGTVHNVHKQELIWVGLGMAVLVVPLHSQSGPDKPLIERTIHIDLRHIVKVETEAAQAAP